MQEVSRFRLPEPLRAPILLVRAAAPELRILATGAGPDLGWSRFTRGDLRIATMPGAHWSLLQTESLGAVARAARTWLESLPGEDLAPEPGTRRASVSADVYDPR